MTKAPKKPAAKKTSKKAATAPVVISDAEVALVARYPHQTIAPGSYRVAGGREGWGNKHTVVIVCCLCDKHRILATSDLQWETTKYCVKCAADVKKNRRKTQQEKKSQ